MNFHKIVVVKKYSELIGQPPVPKIIQPTLKLPVYSIGIGAFIEPTTLLVLGSISLIALIDNHLFSSDSSFADTFHNIAMFAIAGFTIWKTFSLLSVITSVFFRL